MVERWLDVCFQYRRRLAVALVLVPCLLAAAGLLVDRSQAVEARVRAEQPILLLANVDHPAASGRPADAAATLMRELVASDSFLNKTIGAADPTLGSPDGERQSSLRRDFRSHLRIGSDGANVMTLTYQTDRPRLGIALLRSLITEFESNAVTLILGQTSASTGSGETSLRGAHQAVEQVYRQLGSRPPTTSPQLRRLYLLEKMLETEANAATTAYRTQLSGTAPDTLSASATALLRQGLFQLTDPPATRPKTLDSMAPATTLFWVGVALAVGVEAVLTLGVSLADGRLRSATDVLWRTQIPYIGSTPRVDTALP